MTLGGPCDLAIIKKRLRMEEERRSESVVYLNRLKGGKTQSGDLSVTHICTQH